LNKQIFGNVNWNSIHLLHNTTLHPLIPEIPQSKIGFLNGHQLFNYKKAMLSFPVNYYLIFPIVAALTLE
jgi:hypothetical protein